VQRLVEQPVDDGDVFDGVVRLGRVHYHLAVYQHFSEAEDESVPANIEVEGRIIAVDAVDVPQLHQRAAELMLRLTDGRLLDFVIVTDDGTIRSTGRRLYLPDRLF
jgi:hypothetical protein